MANKIMKTLTIGENTYEIVDETARNNINTLVGDTAVSEQISEAISGIYGIVRKEGSVVSAESLEGLAIEVVSDITFSHSGSGSASPSNVRVIRGWDTANLYRNASYDEAATPVLTANFPETVYNGTLDWTTGTLTVTKIGKILTSESGTYVIQNQNTVATDGIAKFYLKTGDAGWVTPSSAIVTCSHGVNAASGSSGTVPNAVCFNSTRVNLLMNMDYTVCGSTVEEFKAYLDSQVAASTPFTVVYNIAEPYTIQLTPQQLLAIDGNNTVWCDCGNVCATFNCSSSVQLDTTLTMSGTAADAKATGDAIASATSSLVKTVNGAAPDENGNVSVQAGVTSVNGQTGDVTIEQYDVLPVSKGGTNATTAIGARENLLMIVSDTEPASPVEGMLWFDIS